MGAISVLVVHTSSRTHIWEFEAFFALSVIASLGGRLSVGPEFVLSSRPFPVDLWSTINVGLKGPDLYGNCKPPDQLRLSHCFFLRVSHFLCKALYFASTNRFLRELNA